MAQSSGRTRSRHRASRLLSVAVLASALAAGGCSAPTKPAIQLSDCTVQGVAARCSMFSVPENRLSGAGRRIALRVVVVPAEGSGRRPDPVVYFAGGPGDAAGEHVSDMVAVRRVRDRDLVFVDQRGTGGSHRLTCPSPAPGDSDSLDPYVASCLRGLDGDPRFYTTAMAADDVADVLAALGVRQANLYGGSYGATIAQVFLRRHPDLVRTMTLLGGTLLDVPIFERFPATSQAALDDVLGRCGAEPACSAAFPHVAEEWSRLLAELSAAPVTVPADRTPDGQPFVLTADLLASAVHQLLLSTDTAVKVPWVVHSLATATDRVSTVLSLAASLGDVLGGDDQFLVMQYSVRCNEAWARFDPEALRTAGQGSYYTGVALANAQYWQRACPLFPPAVEAADAGPAVAADTPVLLFNGSADPQDPPANVAGAERLWPNSRLVVEPHQAHGISQWQCQESIVDAFLESGSVDGLPTDCAAAVQPPRFVIVA